MDPTLLIAMSLALQEGTTLLSRYVSGDATAEDQLKAWLAARDNYVAAETAFDAAADPVP